MPIVINEFEILVEPPTPPPSQAGVPQPQPEAQPISPEDIVRVQRLHRERMERVRAD